MSFIYLVFCFTYLVKNFHFFHKSSNRFLFCLIHSIEFATLKNLLSCLFFGIHAHHLTFQRWAFLCDISTVGLNFIAFSFEIFIRISIWKWQQSWECFVTWKNRRLDLKIRYLFLVSFVYVFLFLFYSF